MDSFGRDCDFAVMFRGDVDWFSRRIAFYALEFRNHFIGCYRGVALVVGAVDTPV